MFGGNLRESKEVNVVLQGADVDIAAFEEILRYVYTGDVALNQDNVYCVLRASEFFKLPSVEKLCTQFIQQNLPIVGMFEAFTFACLTKKTLLMESLSRYIMEHFDEYCKDDEFVEFSFDDLNVLLSQRWYLSVKNEYHLFVAIIQWINYARESREKYLENLIDKMEFRFISCPVNLAELTRNTCRSEELVASSTDARNALEISSSELGLHVYVRSDDKKTRVFSTNKSISKWTVSCESKSSFKELKNVALHDYLYCLDYSDSNQVTFRACTTIDVFTKLSTVRMLKSPPAASEAFELCSLQNCVYVNNYAGVNSTKETDASNSLFGQKEISQGIYMYNAEIDKWFSVPLLETELSYSAMVSYDNLLYLFGGRPAMKTSCPQDHIDVQVLDNRTSKWQVVKKNTREHIYVVHCVHEGKVYTWSYDEGYPERYIRVYDPVAGKWENLVLPFEERFPTFSYRYDLISYKSWLWAFAPNGFLEGRIVRTYNACTQEWKPSPILGTVGITDDGERSTYVHDIIVFKCSEI